MIHTPRGWPRQNINEPLFHLKLYVHKCKSRIQNNTMTKSKCRRKRLNTHETQYRKFWHWSTILQVNSGLEISVALQLSTLAKPSASSRTHHNKRILYSESGSIWVYKYKYHPNYINQTERGGITINIIK